MPKKGGREREERENERKREGDNREVNQQDKRGHNYTVHIRLEFKSCLRTLRLEFLFGLGQSCVRLESVGCILQLLQKEYH